MRVACSSMTLRNSSRAMAIVLGGAAQRLDETLDARQWRADLMAGIGDKVGAHLFHALELR